MPDTPSHGTSKHDAPAPFGDPGADARELDTDDRSQGRLYQLLVDSVRDYAIFLLDPQGHVATWNIGAERIKQYHAKEILGRHFSIFYPADQIAGGFPQHELDVAAREGRFEDEGWRIRKDGSRFWANVVITALRDPRGNLVGFAKITRDLTQRRAAEEQARRLAAEQAARAEADRQREELTHLNEQLQNQAIELEQQTEEAQMLSEELELANDDLQRALAEANEARQSAELAEHRVAFLAEASVRLSESLDVEETLRTIAELAVPALADWCFVEVLERGRVRQAAIVHRRPEMVALAREALSKYPIDLNATFGTGKVLRTGEPELNPDIPDAALASVAQDANHLAILHKVGFRSSLSVPLEDAAGRAMAVLSLVTAESGRRFGGADLAMAQEVARRASAALTSARLYAAGQAALRRATALQQVSSALVGTLTAVEVAQVIVREGQAAIGAAAASFAYLGEPGRTFEMLASEGYADAMAHTYAHFPLTPGRPASDAVLEDRAIYLSSIEEVEARYPEVGPVFRSTRFGAYVALPIRSATRIVAALSFSFAERREFDAEDRAFLETLASAASQALERARLVDAERAARAEAEAASRAKSEFLTTMSHELRTPLNAIAGYVQLLEMGIRGPVTEAQREDLDRIRRSQLHLTTLINEVLSYARLESGAVTYDVRPTLVADVVAAAAPLIEPQRTAKRIGLDIRLPELAGRPPLHVLADPDKLQQILVNLLSNAVKFTPEGGQVVVELRAAPFARGMAEVRVSDTGVGIAPDKLEAIFEPFVQVGRSLNNPGEGTGLGLAISRDLARGMGGDVRAESEGRGSTFIVTIPAVVV